MTPQEAGELLVLMQGTWPRMCPDAVAARLWTEDLMRCDKAAALEAFRGLRDFSDKTPSWAVFRDSYQSQVRRRGLSAPALDRASDPEPTDEERARVKVMLEDLARKLSVGGKRAGGKARAR